MPRALIGPGGARGGENAPRHMSPLLQVPRALTQGGDRPGGGHPRRNKDGDDRTSVLNTPAGVRTTAQLAQRQRRSPTPRRQSIPLPAPNIIKQDPVVFHKSSVGLNEGGQRLSATPLTSPTELPPGGDTFPWMENIPERLVQRLRWTQGTSPKVPSSGPIIVLLYAGKEDPTSLDSCLHANYPHLSSMVVAVDILRSGPKGNHMLRAVWSALHGSKAGPSGLHWGRTQLQDMVHPAPHTKTGGPHPGARTHSRDTLGPPTPGPGRPDSA